MNKGFLVTVFLLLSLSSTGFAANSYEIQLVVSKYVLGPNENISITGYLRNISSNSTDNVTTLVAGGTVVVSVIDSANSTLNTTTLTTNENGTFFSRSSFNPSAQAVIAPNSTGIYTLLANYTAVENVTSKTTVVVVSTKVDDIQFQLPRVNSYSSENVTVTVKTVQKVGGSFVAVANVSLNITMRHTNDSVINSYSCTTGSAGTCSFNATVPSAAGTYVFEANNFVGFTNFNVVPFDVEVYIKDSSSITYKNIFTKGESGFIEVRVSYNSTTPTGSYNATGHVADTSGNVVLNLSSVLLNSTNGFVDKISFTATNSLAVGFYIVKISVTKEGGDTVNSTANFQIRDWSLTFNKATKNSGFEYGYTAFINATVLFEAYPIERANGTVVENLTANFTVALKNSLGTAVRNSTVRYNATCGAKPCYEFNLTMPDVTGDYTLSVSLNYSGDYQTADRTLKATDLTASANPTDSEGSLKELFGTAEFVYISLSGKNMTSSINVSDVEVAGVTYENGTKMSYSETNLTLMNLSDSALKWAWNSSSRRIVLDPPKTGGAYILEVYVNNKSAAVTTRFGIRPYDICMSAKGSSDTTTSDYWYQFRTSDTIYFHMKISEAQNLAGKATSGSNSSGFSSSYGRTSQCSFDSTKKRSINNATVTVESVLNTQSGKIELLNTTASTCSSVDSTGGYVCTVQAADGVWDGGRHVVTISVVGDDRETSSRGNGFFEARAFYIYGYSSNWANKGDSNITLNINAYEAGGGWWNSASGLSGTAVVDSINYYGGVGEWIWPPIKSDYNVTGLNMTITNGVGSTTLAANRTKTGLWAGGYYSAVIRATINNQVDYGEAWFNIRNWDAYATPVEIRGSTFDAKYSVSTKQNVSLYVRITQAGDWSDYSGRRLLGNITIKVKKLIDYSQYPAREINEGNFSANLININETSPWYSSASPNTHSNYLINISSATGQWEPGYYSVILDLNGTETGYGYFNAISFYINTQPTNANGSSYMYNNKGNTPVYFNVTATKSYKSIYTSADFVNATITEAVVRLWDQTTQTQREFKYPTEINITPLLVNGSGIINMSYPAGSWPSGWYNGEIKMKDNTDNSTAKGWIWFSVQPFRVTASTTSYSIGTRQNVTVNMNIYEPDWNNNALLNGNYTVSSVEDTSWSSGAYTITRLNYTYNSTAGLFRNSTTLTINPTGGKWRPGYKSGMITVKDNVTNDTQTSWFSFYATPFTDTAIRTSAANIGSNGNVTVNVTLAASGVPAAGNMSSAFYWGWPSKTRYRFKIGSCDSLTSTTCLINGSAIVTILPPSGGWPEGYNYVYLEYVEPDDGTAFVQGQYVYFYVKQTISGYMYSVNQQAYWQNAFGQAENVTMFLYSLQNLSGSTLTVNVTNAQIAKTSSNCWTDSCRSYQNATFEVVNFTSNNFVNTGRTNMTSSGYVRINASGGSWALGDYAVRIFVTDMASGDTGIIKDATFRVIDKTAPTVLITHPSSEQIINSTNITFRATTSEQVMCQLTIYDYGTFDRYFCGANQTGGNNTNPAACNRTKFNNLTTYYTVGASKWGASSGSLFQTDSTAHIYNHFTSGMTINQNYTVKFDCWDTDWNYATNSTTFNLLGKGANTTGNTLTINITLPLNTTYNTNTIPLNFTISGGTSYQCHFVLNGVVVNFYSCANTTFTAAQGTNSITVFANNSLGTTFNSSTRFFTVNASQLVINVTSPSNATYTTTNVSLNFSVSNGVPSACWYNMNSGITNTTIQNCANTTISTEGIVVTLTVYANNSIGVVSNSSRITFTVDATGPSISFVPPTPDNGSTVNASYVYINVTLSDYVTDLAVLEFNGTNYTMNYTTSRFEWFRNHTGLNQGTYTYKVYANDTAGNRNSTAFRTVRINNTG